MRSLLMLAVLLAVWVGGARAEAQTRFARGQTLGLEIGLGGGWPVDNTDYTRTLETFGFTRNFDATRFRFSAAAEVVLVRYFSVLLQTNSLGRQEWYRDSGIGPRDHFQWKTWTLDVHLRAFYPIREWARVYVQFGVGPTFSPTKLDVRAQTPREQTRFKELEVGYNLAGLGGFELLPAKHFGFFAQGGYIHAPFPKNELGDRHQSGGGLVLVGLSFRFGRPR